MQFLFGAGDFYGIPLTDALGNTVANPTPIKLGVLQEMSLEFSGDVKELYGQYKFAVDVAGGKNKISGKVKHAQISGAAVSSLFFGQGMSSGTMMAAYSDTTGAAIPAAPSTITIAPPGTGTFIEDLGVIDSNGLPMTCVASAPTAGQYSVSATGVYTFVTADSGKTVFISYRYSAAAAGAKLISVTNQPMGAAPLIKAQMQVSYRGKRALVVLHNAIFTKLGLFGTKLDDYSVPELDFSGFANGAQQVADIYVSE
ncbi:MAG: hypothetical protein FWD62_15460 [Betaproteobacteria bacterium]|nr:hypothetical protein [Betaproteobacteria bacterium]